jgi:hypothetical protein
VLDHEELEQGSVLLTALQLYQDHELSQQSISAVEQEQKEVEQQLV